MYVANEDFHSPFTGLIIVRGQVVLVPANEIDGETLKSLVASGKVREGSGETEGVHFNIPPEMEPQKFHDGSIEQAMKNREEQQQQQGTAQPQSTERFGSSQPLSSFEPEPVAKPEPEADTSASKSKNRK